jgi:hypothetical protein
MSGKHPRAAMVPVRCGGRRYTQAPSASFLQLLGRHVLQGADDLAVARQRARQGVGCIILARGMANVKSPGLRR